MNEFWADERPLYIWSGDVKADLAPVKAAKLALEAAGHEIGRVVPVGVASPGDLPDYIGDRVLAIGSRPPILCNYALTSENTSAAGWQRALSWVLGITEHDEKATLVDDVMVSTFGAGAIELSPELLDGERKMGAYLRGAE